MASFRKLKGGWRAEVWCKGVRASSVFEKKADAQRWAAELEAEILSGQRGASVGVKTLADAIVRYRDEVSPAHRGHRREAVSLDRWLRDHPLRGARIDEIRPLSISDWRDARLREVSSGTVIREMTMLRGVFESARRDWGWISVNPMKDVRRPKAPRARTRLPTEVEIQRLLDALGYDDDLPVVGHSQRVAVAMLLAIETAMRAGELCGLRWDQVDCVRRLAQLRRGETKNDDARDVPLSMRALALLERVRSDDATVLRLRPTNLDALFRKARDRCGIVDLHFHDFRAYALTRLSKKVDVLTLARISGHRDLKQLMVYYRESMADVAARLD